MKMASRRHKPWLKMVSADSSIIYALMVRLGANKSCLYEL